MELRVESAEGQHLPNDSYIGVRIGDVLKQGRYEPNSCYHFPLVERRRNAKIDMYQHIGSCMVAVNPDVNSLTEVNVCSCHPSFPGTTLKVSVQSRNGHTTQQQQREQKTKSVRSQANDYLYKFNIEERLSDAVKTMFKVQPEDPIEFLCTQLGSTPPVKPAQSTFVQVEGKPTMPSKDNDQGRSSAKTVDVTPSQEPAHLNLKTMEIRVESAQGQHMPNDSYIGVRIGDVLKQGRYEPNSCYNFPLVERRRNAQIDIYQRIGSCVVAVDPDVKSPTEVNVCSCHPSFPGTTLKVSVQPRNEHTAQQQREQKTKAAKSQIKDYLSKFNIEQRLSNAVKTMLEVQPEDPIAFLCTQLGGTPPVNTVQAEPTKSVQVEDKPAMPSTNNDQGRSSANTVDVTTPSQEPGRSSANAGDATTPSQEPSARSAAKEQDAIDLRWQTCMLPEKTHEDDRLARALMVAQPSQAAVGTGIDGEAVQEKAAGLMRSSALDVNLKGALTEVEAKEPAKPAHVSIQEQSEGESKKDATRRKAETVPMETPNPLLQAGANRPLEASLQRATAEAMPNQEDQIEQDEKRQKTERVRMKAANILLQAAANGDLKAALPQIKAEAKPEQDDQTELDERRQKTESVRRKAANMLLQAAANGDLEAALQQTKAEAKPKKDDQTELDEKRRKHESIRMKTADVLLQAAANGNLEMAFQQAKVEAKPEQNDQDELDEKRRKIENVRIKTARILLQAEANGDLEAALQRAKVEAMPNQDDQTEQDEKRQKTEMKTANVLLHAAANGDLKAALQQTNAEAKPKQDDQAELNEKKQTTESVPIKSADVSMQAPANGDLEAALEQTKAEAKPKQDDQTELDEKRRKYESIRMKTANILLQAEGNGDLEAALQQTKAEAKPKQDDQAELDEEKRTTESVPMKTADVLLQAEANGDLEVSLTQTKAEAKPNRSEAQKEKDMESVRLETSNLLLMKADTGDLADALTQVWPETYEQQSLPTGGSGFLPGDKVIARHHYQAQDDDEITLQVGDIMTIVAMDEEDDGWYIADMNGRQGLIPWNFVERVQA
eukprot:TRINITY_DN111_c1_g2_i2.p1 TRINITY_DN111_c1_g2~~TRINITY_DN111_c1_g2_i2.p1  ORF type:complete len:1061 (-),score=263.42 TRINITY_DN111_c1_g2_i2:666-3848(-)